jgi:hypothetical protein
MSMRTFFNFAVCLTILSTFLSGQNQSCGTSSSDMVIASEIFRKAGLSSRPASLRGSNNIPIKFHLVNNSAGLGRVSTNDILNQFAKLNSEFKDYNLSFYLKDNYKFNIINDTRIFDNARQNEALIASYKDPNAINVFVVNKIPSSTDNQTLLGYYSTTSDFVVIIKNQVELYTNTLAHEIGHFFNLRHTFHGWEAEPYDEKIHGQQVLFDLAPESNIKVELANKSNCTTAADQVCDTPPDFNFGALITNCNFNKIVTDRNGDTIKPMINNQMSYFNRCSKYEFSPGQIARMKTNMSNVLRTNLMRNYTPNTNTVPVASNLISPANNVKINTYNFVSFEWELQNADYYLVELKSSTEIFSYYVEKNNKLTVKNLSPNTLYTWSVRAFNDGFANINTQNPIRIVRTGALLLNNNEIQDIEQINIYPNPVYQNQKLSIDLKTTKDLALNIKLLNTMGEEVFSNNEKIYSGRNKLTLDISNFARGVYIIQMESEGKRSLEKLIIH